MVLFILVETTRPILVAVLIGNLANVCGNYVWVYGHFGMPRLGAVGSGWASTVARWLMLLMLITAARPLLQKHIQSLGRGLLELAPYGKMLRVGLPIGLQLIGQPFKEAQLLQIAHAYEQSTDWHKARPGL